MFWGATQDAWAVTSGFTWAGYLVCLLFLDTALFVLQGLWRKG